MPKGPKGEMRPANVTGCAVYVAKIATGEIPEETKPTVPARAAGGKRGGRARADRLTPERRSEIARMAAEARWGADRSVITCAWYVHLTRQG